jgi:hypothetical protein
VVFPDEVRNPVSHATRRHQVHAVGDMRPQNTSAFLRRAI